MSLASFVRLSPNLESGNSGGRGASQIWDRGTEVHEGFIVLPLNDVQCSAFRDHTSDSERDVGWQVLAHSSRIFRRDSEIKMRAIAIGVWGRETLMQRADPGKPRREALDEVPCSPVFAACSCMRSTVSILARSNQWLS